MDVGKFNHITNTSTGFQGLGSVGKREHETAHPNRTAGIARVFSRQADPGDIASPLL